MVIGALLTTLTQSSSATNGIVIVMVAANPSLIDSGFYLVLGATIGALMPTFLAAIKSTILAKRVTFSMIIVRTFGALVGTIIVWALSGQILNLLARVPEDNIGIMLAIFTVIYNLIFIALTMPLTTPIERLSIKLFKDKDALKKRESLHHIDDNLLNTPSVAIIQVKKEIEDMLELSRINLNLGIDIVISQDFTSAKELEEREDEIDFINTALSDYLIKLSAKASLHDETKIGSYYHVINDIERIGDHANNFLKMARRMSSEDLMFSDIAKNEFIQYKVVLEEMFVISSKIFMDHDYQDLERLHALEDETDELKEKFSNQHFERIRKNECNNELSPFHSNLLAELERCADHLTNIGYSIVNPTGDVVKHTTKHLEQ